MPDAQSFAQDCGARTTYRWTPFGTHAGTGNHVHIIGYEDWLIGEDGLIAESLGHFDEHARQVEHGTRQQPHS